MANKHSPKKNSADFGTAEHYYFKIESKPVNTFYKIRYLTQDGWKFLLDDYTEKDIQYYLKYWQQVCPELRYEAIKCEVLHFEN